MKKEYDLHRHPEFEEVHEDDLNALSDFKKSLGIKQKVTDASFGNDSSFSVATPSPSTGTSSRLGTLSGVSKGSRTSRRSGMSAHSELSPLYEEDDAENDGGDGGKDDNGESDGSPTPQKRRRLDSSSKHRGEQSSVGSSIAKSKYNQRSIPEENERDGSDSGKDSEE